MVYGDRKSLEQPYLLTLVSVEGHLGSCRCQHWAFLCVCAFTHANMQVHRHAQISVYYCLIMVSLESQGKM